MMRVLIFFDSRHQTEAVQIVAHALETNLGAQVVLGGPGCAESYFGTTLPRSLDIETSGRIFSSRIGLRSVLKLGQWASGVLRFHLRRLVRQSRILVRRRLGYKKFRYSSIRRLLNANESVRVEAKGHGWVSVRFNQVLQAVRRIVSIAVERTRPRYWVMFIRMVKRSYEIGAVAYLGQLPNLDPVVYAKNMHLRVLFGLKRIHRDHGVVGVLTALLAAPLLLVSRILGMDIIVSIREYKDMLKQARFALDDSNADLLVVLEDNVEGLTGIVTHAARCNSIPFIIVPDYIPNPLEPARFYANSLDHIVADLRSVIVAVLLPHWRLRLGRRSLLRLPPKDVISRKLLGADRPQPWILNSGYAAAISVEGQAMMSHYRSLGFIENKLHPIGSPRDDILWQQVQESIDKRRRITEELELDARLPTVLCSFPPDQYGPSGAVNAGFEFDSYNQLVSRWFDVLNDMVSAANVVVKPHPRLNVERLVDFAGDRIRLSTVSTETLLPLADLYVASVSTTIRWALALGIPVINYDTYGYGYQDFRAAGGLIEVSRIDDFQRELSIHLFDQAAAAELRRCAQIDAQTWGRVDGEFGVRFSDLARSVVAGGASFTSGHSSGWKLPRQADAI